MSYANVEKYSILIFQQPYNKTNMLFAILIVCCFYVLFPNDLCTKMPIPTWPLMIVLQMKSCCFIVPSIRKNNRGSIQSTLHLFLIHLNYLYGFTMPCWTFCSLVYHIALCHQQTWINPQSPSFNSFDPMAPQVGACQLENEPFSSLFQSVSVC